MPTYDYRCPKCGTIREEMHGMMDAPAVMCLSCRIQMQKLIGRGGGIIFKGPGFHATDYPKEPKRKERK